MYSFSKYPLFSTRKAPGKVYIPFNFPSKVQESPDNENTPSEPRTFHLFLALPVELRLRIYELALPQRVIEIQLKPEPSESGAPVGTFSAENVVGWDDNEEEVEGEESVNPNTPGHKAMISRPSIPSLFHVSREARYSCLESWYQPCHGAAFNSHRKFPYNLWNPHKDTLYVAQSLYSFRAAEFDTMFSATAARLLGNPRPFILDWLSTVRPADVAEIERLGISWSDMHFEELAPMLDSMKPFTRLKEIVICFFEQREDNMELRLMGKMRGKLGLLFVRPEEARVRGRYMQRQLEDKIRLAETLNSEMVEEEQRRKTEEGVRWKGPRFSVRLSRFALGGETV